MVLRVIATTSLSNHRWRNVMKRLLVAALFALTVPLAAIAQTADPTAKPAANSPATKQAEDLPGAKSDTGTTADPTAKPAANSPATKQADDLPGAKAGTGTTANPTAKPAESSITEKQKTDMAK